MSLTQINKAGLDEIALDHVFTIGASGSSAYTFQGEGLNGTVNNPTLYLTRGKTYRFENGSGGHPIRIQSTSGASGTAYNTGVTNNAGSGTVIVEVQHDAPDVLYYQCTSHAAMNGILYITGALADGGVTTAKIAGGAVTEGKIASNAINTAKIVDGNVTGPKIADATIGLDKLAHGTSSNDGKFLRANNGADPTFETVNTDLVSDTSPQLGGNLDVNTKNIVFGDSSDGSSDDVLSFGASGDLKIFHQADQSRIVESGPSVLKIMGSDVRLSNAGNTADYMQCNDGAEVQLFHNGSKKFETSSTGVSITGNATISGAINTSDNQNINVGNGGDLKIFHNGTNSVIENATGALVVKPEGLMRIQDRTTDEVRADFVDNGEVSLYHNNIKKIETTSTGIKITGETEAGGGATSGNIQMVNGGRKNTIGNSFSSSSTESRIEFGVSDGSTSGGTNRVASISYAGIAFGTDTASANRLDDYEEGTFTPAIGSGYSYANTITYTNQHGHYTKIGNQVFAYVYVRPNGNSAHGGNIIEDGNSLYMTGLPFTNSSTSMQEGGGYITYTNGYFDSSGTGYENLYPMPWVPVNSSYIYFHTAADGNNLRGNETNPNNRYIVFHLRYRVT